MPRRAFSRRRFLVGAAVLGAVAAGPRVAGAQAPAARTLVPREVFFGNPDVAGARLSPDGESIAYVAPVDGVRNLWLAPLRDLAAARPLTRVTSRPIAAFFQWAYDNRHLVFFEDHDGDENWRASRVDLRDGAIVPLTPPRGVRAYVQQASPRFPTTMLLAHNERDRRHHDLYRVDVVTGRAERLFENTRFGGFVTDRALSVRLGWEMGPDGRLEWHALGRDGTWAPFMTVALGDADGTRTVGWSRDGRTLYLLDARGRDKAALVAMDMATRTTRVIATMPDVDLKDVVLDEVTQQPLAVGGMLERQRWQAVDPRFARELRLLRAASPGDAYPSGFSVDGRKALVYFERDDASPEYALYDRGTRRVRTLFPVRRRLAGVPLRPLEPVVVSARDGLRIPCYLTRPEPGARNAPLVMAIHGGPYLRDRWGYDGTHQWLANRGYAVLSVNYRGSTGYGKAFVTAADREWGGKMHDDLIDALDWAVAGGVADPRRVGFFGGSYGGFAALTAATRTPERFACIVDVFGIANLLTFMAAIPPYWRPWFPLWKNRVGDPDTPEGRAFLEARSPLTHIQRAFRPILIVQGLEDVRVTRAESEQMVAALRRRSVPVTYVTFRDEGHGFLRPENQIAFRAVTEVFLARHLGGAAQPIDRERDFRGSSLAVEVGAELVPGLEG